jgi:NADH-quinone oxidoreductase subunit J
LTVVLARNLFHSALGLVAAFFGAAGIYLVAEAEFIGVSQVLVYVGAISTLITFAIMLTRGMMFGATSPRNRQSGTAAMITLLAFVVLWALVSTIPWPQAGEANRGRRGHHRWTWPRLCQRVRRALPAAGHVAVCVALAGAIVLARDRK